MTKTIEPTYAWRDGFRANGLSAKDVAKELQEIIRQHKDEGVQAEAVVKRARSPNSALHGAFIWDDAAAAHEHRLSIARGLLRSVRIILPDETEIRAFVSVPEPDQQSSRYYLREQVLSHKELHKRALTEAVRQVTGVLNRFKDLAELNTVRQALEVVRQQLLKEVA